MATGLPYHPDRYIEQEQKDREEGVYLSRRYTDLENLEAPTHGLTHAEHRTGTTAHLPCVDHELVHGAREIVGRACPISLPASADTMLT
jgi:hypothetical protein